MFIGYNLDLNNNHDLFGNKNYEEEFKMQEIENKSILKEVTLNGIVNATDIEKDWFPGIKADIFLSHSHKDEVLTKHLAGWLEHNFGLTCFIDSTVWGYADELLHFINNQYSDKRKRKNSFLYNYNKCNKASSHVNCILTIALQKMIDKVEAIFFINTRNSIENYENISKNSTYSPWIYTEIISTQLIRKRKLSEYREKILTESGLIKKTADIQEVLKIRYNVSLEHFVDLSLKNLQVWESGFKSFFSKETQHPLDVLYNITNVFESDSTLK